jgi:hypothetical protein
MIYLALWLVVLGGSGAHAANINQQTAGWCSPTVGQAGGNVIINCQGVDPQANQLLNERLNRTNLALEEKIREANELARKYHELLQQVNAIQDNKLTTQVKGLLRELKLEQADAVLKKSAISMNQYTAIQDGMSYQQVIRILGRPGMEISRSGNIAAYLWQNPDTSVVNVTFINNEVGVKTQYGLR